MGRRVGVGAINEVRSALEISRTTLLAAVEHVDEALVMVGKVEHIANMRTKDAIIAYMRDADMGAGPAEVADALRLAGHGVTDDAINQAMYRMSKRGELTLVSHGRYKLVVDVDVERTPTTDLAQDDEPKAE